MTAPPLRLGRDIVAMALDRPGAVVAGRAGSVPFAASILIPDYDREIQRHYGGAAGPDLAAACERAGIAFDLPQFGLLCRFDRPVEIVAHDAEFVLDDDLRAAVAAVGPVILQNAYLGEATRGRCHRNIFANLEFHVDRGPGLPNQYSLFTRDPFDDAQRLPRQSSTLFVANIVAHLQNRLEHPESGGAAAGGRRMKYAIFRDAPVEPLFGRVMLQQAWNAPAGTGEICVIDNRTVLHASYHPNPKQRGYPIGARYLY
ncbi:MAG: hypothetical protein MI806_21635 [Minwuiales bacterium]|nr:hypothetical protein [Minwuiales bacterium]